MILRISESYFLKFIWTLLGNPHFLVEIAGIVPCTYSLCTGRRAAVIASYSHSSQPETQHTGWECSQVQKWQFLVKICLKIKVASKPQSSPIAPSKFHSVVYKKKIYLDKELRLRPEKMSESIPLWTLRSSSSNSIWFAALVASWALRYSTVSSWARVFFRYVFSANEEAQTETELAAIAIALKLANQIIGYNSSWARVFYFCCF